MVNLVSSTFSDPKYCKKSLDFRVNHFKNQIIIFGIMGSSIILVEFYNDFILHSERDFKTFFYGFSLFLVFSVVYLADITTVIRFHLTLYTIWILNMYYIGYDYVFSLQRDEQYVVLILLVHC